MTFEHGYGFYFSGGKDGAPAVTPSTWDSATKSPRISLSPDLLTADGDDTGWGSVRSTLSKTAARGFAGEMIGPFSYGANGGVGFANAAADLTTPGFLGGDTDSLMWRATGDIFYGGSTTTITGYSLGDTLFMHYDPATDIFEGFVNGVSAGTRSAPGLGATFFAAFAEFFSSTLSSFTADFTADGPGGRSRWDA